MKIVTVIQARRGSSRLPDKVLMPLQGKPLLVQMVERVKASKLAGTIVVATTTDNKDDVLEEICIHHHYSCFRGHPTDLLDRHYKAALPYQPDAVIKIPSDCPLIDPYIIDKVIRFYMDNSDRYDFVSNLHPPTYPDGNDVEIMNWKSLENAWKNAERLLEREHTTPYIWENPDKFNIGNVEWEKGLDYSMSHRFTIDYTEDYEFIKKVFDALYPNNPLFTLDDILQLLEKNPDIYQINAKFAGVNWYRNHLDELKTITKNQTKTI